MPANIKHSLWTWYPQSWRPSCSPVPYRELWNVCVGVISYRNLSPTGSKTGWTKLLKNSFCACTGSLWTVVKLCSWYHVSSTKLEYFTGSCSSCMFTSSCIVAEPSLIPAIIRVICAPGVAPESTDTVDFLPNVWVFTWVEANVASPSVPQFISWKDSCLLSVP